MFSAITDSTLSMVHVNVSNGSSSFQLLPSNILPQILPGDSPIFPTFDSMFLYTEAIFLLIIGSEPVHQMHLV